MDLSIVIVNWNSVEFTKKCIASIQSTTSGLDYEVIVVDNASDDDCSQLMSQACPVVKVISCTRNLGFAAANNVGCSHSCGKNILFLNPDTIVRGDAVRKMITRLNTSTDVGAVGCRLLNGDLTIQTSCVQPFPNIMNQLLALDWLKRQWPRLSLWGMRALFTDSSFTDVQTVSGACIMVKRDVYVSVDGFSTEYFLYAEEVDLCEKIRRSGRRVCHVGDAQVVHFGGQSTKQKRNGFSDVMMRASVYTLLRKFRGEKYAEVYRILLFMSAFARSIILLPTLIIAFARSRPSATADTFYKWFLIASWALTRRTPRALAVANSEREVL